MNRGALLAVVAGVGAALVISLSPVRMAHAQACPRVMAGLICPPIAEQGEERQAALRALDLAGREAVTRADYGSAARAFGCLVQSDSTPESAGNLAVVLREHGGLGDALLIARCAEQLAGPGAVQDRARARREDIERRLGFAVPPARLPPAPQPTTTLASPMRPDAGESRHDAAPSPSPMRIRRGWSYVALAFGAAVLLGSVVVYGFAHARANDFQREQSTNGKTLLAEDLRQEARDLEIGSWIGAGVGLAAATTGGCLLTF